MTSTTSFMSSISQTLPTSKSSVKTSSHLTTSEIVGISIGVMFLVAIFSKIIITLLRPCLIHILLIRHGLIEQIYSVRSTRSHTFHNIDQLSHLPEQYKIATNKRMAAYTYNKNIRDVSTSSGITETTLVQVNV